MEKFKLLMNYWESFEWQKISMPASSYRGKRNVKFEDENQTLAWITYQNYFRLYKKLVEIPDSNDRV